MFNISNVYEFYFLRLLVHMHVHTEPVSISTKNMQLVTFSRHGLLIIFQLTDTCQCYLIWQRAMTMTLVNTQNNIR